MKEAKDEAVRDAGILCCRSGRQHYEIARYGTLCEWAKALCLNEARPF